MSIRTRTEVVKTLLGSATFPIAAAQGEYCVLEMVPMGPPQQDTGLPEECGRIFREFPSRTRDPMAAGTRTYRENDGTPMQWMLRLARRG